MKMSRYESVSKQNEEKFRRLTGVKRKTFEKMTEILREAHTNKVHFQPYFGTMMLYEITRMSFRSITTTNSCAVC